MNLPFLCEKSRYYIDNEILAVHRLQLYHLDVASFRCSYKLSLFVCSEFWKWSRRLCLVYHRNATGAVASVIDEAALPEIRHRACDLFS